MANADKLQYAIYKFRLPIHEGIHTSILNETESPACANIIHGTTSLLNHIGAIEYIGQIRHIVDIHVLDCSNLVYHTCRNAINYVTRNQGHSIHNILYILH